MDRSSGENRSQSTGGNPAPPVADSGEVSQYRVVRAKRLRTGRGNAADPPGIHQDERGPRWRRSPGEQQTYNQQRNGGAALSGNLALAREQRRDEEQALIAAAHGQSGRRQ